MREKNELCVEPAQHKNQFIGQVERSHAIVCVPVCVYEHVNTCVRVCATRFWSRQIQVQLKTFTQAASCLIRRIMQQRMDPSRHTPTHTHTHTLGWLEKRFKHLQLAKH